MDASIENELRRLQRAAITQVTARFTELFGHEPGSTHRNHLVRRIAWKLQADKLGDISAEAVARAAELAHAVQLSGSTGGARARRIRRTKHNQSDPRLPVPGTELGREYRGRVVSVAVLKNGYEYKGELYRSLSAVARAITGTPWNGLVFFGLAKRGDTAKQKKVRARAA
jgi:hypothetical protein